MALEPTKKWREAAAAGSAQPVLLFDFKPTVLYAEKNFRGDWAAGSQVIGLDLEHPTDELRLARAEITHPAQQLKQNYRAILLHSEPKRTLMGGTWTERYYNYPVTFVQIVKFSTAFRLSRLYLGINNRENKARVSFTVQILSNFRDFRNVLPLGMGGYRRERLDVPSEIARILEGADVLAERTIDLARDTLDESQGGPVQGVDLETDSDGRKWRILDFSQENIWLPGGNSPCAIAIKLVNSENVSYAELLGGDSRNDYEAGNLYRFNAEAGLFAEVEASLSFKITAFGYQKTGSGIWEFDLGETPSSDLSGELELRYVEPRGTSLSFAMREAATQGLLASSGWKAVSDGAKLTKRWVQVRPTLSSDSDQLATPRVYSMRVAFRSSHKFALASEPLFGYPNVVSQAPDYSAEGDPLSGEAQATDTSRIEMLDPGGMISALFSRYAMKNDEIQVKLGFAGAGLAESDFLHFKTIWIEDWEIEHGRVVVHGYDQQIRFRQAEAPTPDDPPEMTEEIHYERMNPARIKRDLLQRARIRPSKINNANFEALESAFDWELSHVIEKPGSLQAVDTELNRHLLGFQVVDEKGKWRFAYAELAANPDPDTESLGGNDLIVGSEAFYPGRKHLRNVVAVLFGGRGSDDKQYRGIQIDYDQASEKANKEHAPDKLHSEFIPIDSPGVAAAVARRRLNLQKQGVRMIEWSTRLKFAYLQIGDHINLDSTLYSRPGVSEANPLLVMVTRKNIDRNLAQIHWSALVLLDGAESEESAPAVDPPRNVAVTAGGDGSVTWFWEASADDTGAAGQKYELFQRPAHLDDWGAKKLTVAADGSADYSQPDSDFAELVAYDFGVRFVDSNGRASSIAAEEDVLLTDSPLDPPGVDDYALLNIPGAVQIFIKNEVAGAHHYNVYVRPSMNAGWQLAGTIPANAERRDAFACVPPNPYKNDSERWMAFALSTVDRWGREGERGIERTMCYEPMLDADQLLNAPTLASEGGFPQIIRKALGPYQAFSIRLKIVPCSGEQDLAVRYEVWRRDDDGSNQTSWTDWQQLPDCLVEQNQSGDPAPLAIFYDNTDRKLKPGHYYQFKARAVGRNNRPGAFSDSQTVQLTDDTTGPDKPAVTVTSLQLGLLLNISEPAQGGGSCPDFSHFKIECKENGGSWRVLDPEYRATVFVHEVGESSIDKSYQYRVTAYDHSGNASQISDETAPERAGKVGSGSIKVNAVTTGHCNFTVVGTDNVVGTINASTEGLRINAAKIRISGSCEFASGYDPTDKVAALGGQYNSASSGPRVRIFPDANTGILVTDGANDVFKCIVGGTEVGDVIIGSSSGQHVKWDKSAGLLEIEGRLTSNGIYSYSGSEYAQMFNAMFKLHNGSKLVGALDIFDSAGRLRIRTSDGQDRVSIYPAGIALQNGAAIGCNGNIQTDGVYQIGATTVLSGQGNKVDDPSGGTTVDAECRAQLAALIDELESIHILSSS